MDELSRALGVGPTITFCGQTFHVQGKVLRHYALIEAEILKDRPDPMQMMREGCKEFRDNPEALRVFVRECYEQAKTWKNVSGVEMYDWLNTIKGRNFLIWLSIRHNDPASLTLSRVSELVLDDFEQIARKAEQDAIAKEKSEEEAARIGAEARRAKIATVERAIDQASGEDELGNSHGHVRTPAGVALPAGAG